MAEFTRDFLATLTGTGNGSGTRNDASLRSTRLPHRRARRAHGCGTFGERCGCVEGRQQASATIDGRDGRQSLVEQLPRSDDASTLVERALEAIREYGVGSGSVRTIAGTMSLHVELERRLAAFKGTEAAVVFQSGFAANAGTVAVHPDKGRRGRLRRAEPREHHRRLPPEPRDNQGLPAQGRRRGAARSSEDLPSGQRTLVDHRRRVQHGRRPGRIAGAGVARRRARRDHDGGRRACERGVRAETGAARSITSVCTVGSTFRSARCRKPIGALGGYVAGSQIAHRVPAPSRPAVPVLDVASAIRRCDLPRGARRPGTGARASSSACGRTRGSSRPVWRRSASTPGRAKARSPPSLRVRASSR